MNPLRRLLLLALVAPVLSREPEKQAIAFGPSPGTRLQKTIEASFDFAMEDFSLVVDGEDIGAVMGGFDLEVTTDQTVVLDDLYAKMAEARTEVLERTFEEMQGTTNVNFTSEFGEQEQDMDSSSDLEGRTVRFVWNEDSGEYDAAFKEGEDEGGLLDKLSEDVDFLVLLPEGEVGEGDTWTVPLADLEPVAAPGGNMALLPEGSEMENYDELEDLFADRFDNLAALMDGTWECTFQGLNAEDSHLAEIGIDTKAEANLDLSDVILDLIDIFSKEAGGEEVPDITVDTADVGFEFDGEGLLVWNVEEDRFVSFELHGDAVISIDLSVSLDLGDESHEAELFLELSGSYDQGVSTSE